MFHSKFRLPKIIENTGLYSFASFLQKGIGFFLLPVYTAYLTPDDYGILNLLNSIMGFFSILILLSLQGAATRYHFLSTDNDHRKKVWGTILLLVIFNSIIWTSFLIIFHKYLVDPLTGDIGFWKLTILSLFSVALSPVYQFYQQWLQCNEDGKRYTINLICNFSLTVVLNVVFLCCFHLGVLGMLLSTLIVSIIFFIYSIFKFRTHILLSLDKSIAKKAYSYSLPLVPHSVSGYCSVMIDRVLLNKITTSAQLGLYSVANQFGTILSSITTSIDKAYNPVFFRSVESGDINKRMNSIIDSSLIFCSFLALLITFFTPEAIGIMASESFAESWKPVTFICFGYVFNGLYFFYVKPLFLGKTQYVFVISLSQLAANLILNIVLIPKLGYLGAGISFLCSQFASSLIALVLSKKFYRELKFHVSKHFSIILIFFAFSLVIFIIQTIDSISIRIFIKFMVLFILALALYKRYGKVLTNLLLNKR